MQAHASDDVQLTKKTLLSLAERMIEKNVKENKMESEAGELLIAGMMKSG